MMESSFFETSPDILVTDSRGTQIAMTFQSCPGPHARVGSPRVHSSVTNLSFVRCQTVMSPVMRTGRGR
jgi:hypothetical protein